MSVGKERIGDFNNESREDVKEIKEAAANLIDVIDKHCLNGRRKSVALTEIETAQMYAVASLFKGA